MNDGYFVIIYGYQKVLGALHSRNKMSSIINAFN